MHITGTIYYNVAMGSTIWHDIQCYVQCKMSLKVLGRNNGENAMKCKTLCLFHWWETIIGHQTNLKCRSWSTGWSDFRSHPFKYMVDYIHRHYLDNTWWCAFIPLDISWMDGTWSRPFQVYDITVSTEIWLVHWMNVCY